MISLSLYVQLHSCTIHVYISIYIHCVYIFFCEPAAAGWSLDKLYCSTAALRISGAKNPALPGRLDAAGTLDWMNSVKTLSCWNDPGLWTERECVCVEEVSKNVSQHVRELYMFYDRSMNVFVRVCVRTCLFVCVGYTSLGV